VYTVMSFEYALGDCSCLDRCLENLAKLAAESHKGRLRVALASRARGTRNGQRRSSTIQLPHRSQKHEERRFPINHFGSWRRPAGRPAFPEHPPSRERGLRGAKPALGGDYRGSERQPATCGARGVRRIAGEQRRSSIGSLRAPARPQISSCRVNVACGGLGSTRCSASGGERSALGGARCDHAARGGLDAAGY
jgi:hypothetical protein